LSTSSASTEVRDAPIRRFRNRSVLRLRIGFARRYCGSATTSQHQRSTISHLQVRKR